MEVEPVLVEPVHPLLDIFSTEVWAMILDKIEDPTDRLNVANADPLFRNVAAQSKKEDWTLTMFGLALSQLYSHLSDTDVLTLRQLSEGWRNKVDEFLESRNLWKYTNDLYKAKIRLNLWNFQGHTRPFAGEKYNQLVEEMRALPQAKLVGGSVYVQERKRFGPEFLHFFREFGSMAYHLSMALICFTPTVCLEYTTELLSYTPNLRTVYLYYLGCDSENGGRERENVVQLLDQNPLPDLPQLVSLVLFVDLESSNGNGIRQMLDRMLVKYAGQLQQLKTMEFPISLPSVPMPRLSHLAYDVWSREGMRSLRNLEGAPLEKLELNFRFHFCPVELFGILEGYKTSLKSLRIIFPRVEWEPNLDSSTFPDRIHLPRLETLGLGRLRAKSDTSFEFLLSFPKLRRLRLDFEQDFDEEEVDNAGNNDKLGIIKHLGEDGFLNPATFYLSPVWKKLPLLDSVLCGVYKDDEVDPELKTHTRKDYEYYQDKLAKMSFY